MSWERKAISVETTEGVTHFFFFTLFSFSPTEIHFLISLSSAGWSLNEGAAVFSGRWHYEAVCESSPKWTIRGVMLHYSAPVDSKSSHAENVFISNYCWKPYLQHFFSFILRSVFLASGELAEPLSMWVLDMLKFGQSQLSFLLRRSLFKLVWNTGVRYM